MAMVDTPDFPAMGPSVLIYLTPAEAGHTAWHMFFFWSVNSKCLFFWIYTSQATWSIAFVFFFLKTPAVATFCDMHLDKKLTSDL
jgi:hypothetical protein